MAEMTDYIKIESYLKDVPDSFLMKEIQQATGEYPPVLIVAEYNRRKRMRNAAEGQQIGEPKSIVEDIKQEAGLMSAPGAMQTLAARDINQMGPPPEEMRPMPQQMPQQMPQMMPQQMMPMGMAGGGLVAFERGGPIRAQEGIFADLRRYVLPYEDEERRDALNQSISGIGQSILGATSEIPFPRFTPPGADPERSPFGNFLRGRLSQSEDPGYVQPPDYIPPPEEPVISLKRLGLGGKKSETDTMLEMMAQQQAARDKEAAASTQAAAPGAAPGAAKKPPPAAGGLGAFKPGALPSVQPVVDAIQALRDQTKMPTEQALDEAGQARARRYEEDLPFREKEILERRITNRAEQIAKDKDMSFNDALIAAGAAILKSPGTPGSLAWMGEGLSAFGTTMKEGKKDIRKSQELMELSELELAKAESARDAGKFNQYEAGRDKAFDLANKSREFAATNAALAVNQYTARVAAYKLPYEMAETGAKTGYYQALGATAGQPKPKATTAKDALEARKMLMTQAMSTPGVDINDPNVIAEIENYLKANYPGYTPLNIGGPKIRGLEAPATLAPGT
jgi:hypothetical protein